MALLFQGSLWERVDDDFFVSGCVYIAGESACEVIASINLLSIELIQAGSFVSCSRQRWPSRTREKWRRSPLSSATSTKIVSFSWRVGFRKLNSRTRSPALIKAENWIFRSKEAGWVILVNGGMILEIQVKATVNLSKQLKIKVGSSCDGKLAYGGGFRRCILSFSLV